MMTDIGPAGASVKKVEIITTDTIINRAVSRLPVLDFNNGGVMVSSPENKFSPGNARPVLNAGSTPATSTNNRLKGET